MSDVRIVPLAEFVGVEEASSEPLLGVKGQSLLPAGGRLLIYGDGGSGKTTLSVDAVAHLAAGVQWLGIEVPRPLRFLVIENEGPRGPFREKLGEKLLDWQGPPFREQVFVMEEPWAGFSFADLHCTDPASRFIEENEIDVLMAGPLASLGAEGGGTPAEVQAFVGLLDTMKANTSRPYAEWLVHHTNKQGDVSGAWTRVPDTLLHVQGRGNGHISLRIEKARHSSQWHDTAARSLAWAPGRSYTVEDRAPVSADTIADDILAAVREHPGASWTQLRKLRRDASTKLITGNLDQAATVRDRLLDDGLLVNVAPREGQFRLRLADDPDPTRSELRTGLERATSPLGGGDDDPTRSPFPPIRNGVTGTGHHGTDEQAHQ